MDMNLVMGPQIGVLKTGNTIPKQFGVDAASEVSRK